MNKIKLEKPFKNKNFFIALKNSIKGIVTAFLMERNIKIDVVISIIVLLVSLYIKLSYLELIAIVFSIGTVLTAEMFNSAIENIVDLITSEYNERAKVVKDISSGAVLISSIAAAVIGIIIFLNKIVVF